MSLILFFAILLDRLLGDPPNWPHPVRLIGWGITQTESLIRKSKMNLKVGGVMLVITILTGVLVIISGLRVILPPLLFFGVSVYLFYTCLAARCLADEANRIHRSLEQGDLPEARKWLGMIVGRDTEGLSEPEVTRGVVETVSENTVDGVLAPLFYMLIGVPWGLSLELGMLYKAVNTLDSMVGYLHPRYKDIGFASAKLDDLLNFLPARLGSVLMIISGFFLKLDVKNGWAIFVRDRLNHKSPNSGHPEAAIAGLLGVKLGGANRYFGEVVEKPIIGDEKVVLNRSHIKASIRVMYLSEWLVWGIGFILLLLGGQF